MSKSIDYQNAPTSQNGELLKYEMTPIALLKCAPRNARRHGKAQIAAAEMMVAMNRYSTGYVKSIVAATPADQLVEGKPPVVRGLSAQQIDLMTEESARLDREFRLIEQTYGADHLDLVLAAAYVANLLNSAGVVRHLAQFHPDLLTEFQKIAELQKAA
jgi:hypothetical protein